MSDPKRPAPEKLISGGNGGVLIWNIDKTSVPSMTFIGAADAGTASSAAAWKIILIDQTTAVTKIRYAEGSPKFAFVWDDRVGLSYS